MPISSLTDKVHDNFLALGPLLSAGAALAQRNAARFILRLKLSADANPKESPTAEEVVERCYGRSRKGHQSQGVQFPQPNDTGLVQTPVQRQTTLRLSQGSGAARS
jgi:hypothetical protein